MTNKVAACFDQELFILKLGIKGLRAAIIWCELNLHSDLSDVTTAEKWGSNFENRTIPLWSNDCIILLRSRTQRSGTRRQDSWHLQGVFLFLPPPIIITCFQSESKLVLNFVNSSLFVVLARLELVLEWSKVEEYGAAAVSSYLLETAAVRPWCYIDVKNQSKEWFTCNESNEITMCMWIISMISSRFVIIKTIWYPTYVLTWKL